MKDESQLIWEAHTDEPLEEGRGAVPASRTAVDLVDDLVFKSNPIKWNQRVNPTINARNRDASKKSLLKYIAQIEERNRDLEHYEDA